MNRLLSIGLSVAVAPAILVLISHLTGWHLEMDLSRAALGGLVLGAPLIIGGLLGASSKPTARAVSQIMQTHSEGIQETRNRLLKVASNREFWRWAIPIVLSLFFLGTNCKIVAEHPNEQLFYSGLQALWMLVAVVFLRVVIAMFTWSSLEAFILKIFLIAVLLYPLYFLTALTAYVSWRGPEKQHQVALTSYLLLLPGLDRLLEPYGPWIWLTCLALVLGVRHVVQRLRGHPRFKWLGLLASVVLLTPLVDIGPHFALAPLWIYAFFSLRTLVGSLIIWLIVYFLLIVITGLWRKLHRWRSSGTTRS